MLDINIEYVMNRHDANWEGIFFKEQEEKHINRGNVFEACNISLQNEVLKMDKKNKKRCSGYMQHYAENLSTSRTLKILIREP